MAKYGKIGSLPHELRAAGLAPDTMALVNRDRGISPPIPLVPPQKEPHS